MKIDEIKRIKKQIDASKKIVAKERDTLLKLLEDIEDVESNFSQGIYSLKCASEDLESAIETFSEIV